MMNTERSPALGHCCNLVDGRDGRSLTYTQQAVCIPYITLVLMYMNHYSTLSPWNTPSHSLMHAHTRPHTQTLRHPLTRQYLTH